MNASTAGTSRMPVNFDSSARPPNMPAASHQRWSLLSASRTSDQIIATVNGISAVSGATFAINSSCTYSAASGTNNAKTIARQSCVTR